MNTDRSRDDGRTLGDFVEEVLVVCPRCSGRAVVRPIEDPSSTRGSDDSRSRWSLVRRVTCGQCAFTRQQPKRTLTLGVPLDPYFSLPLWLTAEADGHRIWAYNSDHVDHLLRCVSVRLRERAPGQDRQRPQTLIERLPAWMLAASSREPVTKALLALARRADDPAAT